MSSAIASRAIEELISAIELCRETQNEMDNLYSNLTHMIINEMESAVPKYNPSPQTNKRFKSKKPFWNDNLQLKWGILREKEKLFLNCRGKKICEPVRDKSTIVPETPLINFCVNRNALIDGQ